MYDNSKLGDPCPICNKMPYRLIPEYEQSTVVCDCNCWSGGEFTFIGTLNEWQKRVAIVRKQSVADQDWQENIESTDKNKLGISYGTAKACLCLPWGS